MKTKIYFDGDSVTYGKELFDLSKRYSALVCEKLNAEEHNIALNGGSNRRLMRNLIDNLGKFDMYIIQMAKRSRTEWYDEDEDKWQIVTNQPVKSGNYDFWKKYYREIYHDNYGITDELICYNFIRALLVDVPHLILWSGDYDFDLPTDLVYKKGSFPVRRGHPNEEGHQMICDDILNILK
tara:strand:- start:799 stop:1341 length:543 start_codon:yes stop_codon:yes gene_type:complete